ncbi:hypothetical protein [Candidatus Binatus sp.]|uniref:hypothetical protein n=1 Tax=Candidatus Binatus sp. TaxID=2811406 RepID=UPI003C6BCFAE
MIGVCIGGIAIELYDRQGNISRNAKQQQGVNTVDISLNDSDIKVARNMGIDPKAVARLKYKHGKGGLAGVALLGKGGYLGTGLGTGPIPPTDAGWLNDEPGVPIRDVREKENSDDEDVRRPDGSIGKPVQQLGIGIVYPNGDTNVTKRK